METLKELQFAFDTSQISRSTYFRKMKKIREGKSLKRRKGSGRPRKINGKFIQKAVSIALKKLPSIAHISAKKLQTDFKLKITSQFIKAQFRER